jgi:plastocyanin
MPTRFARLLSVGFLAAVVVSGCSAASATWTYAPAPSLTPAPSLAASSQPSGPAATANPNLVMISAFGVKFEQEAATAPAGKPFQIQFDNKDPGTPHNVAIHQGSATGAEIFKGEVFNGPAVKTYDVPAIAAGQYAFVCTVHPSMTGTLTAQ